MAQQIPNPACPATGNHQSIVVLLVDDQRFVGAAIARLLETEQSIELHCCHAAADAIAAANRINPTIILQDLVMPDLDGLTLVALFRRNSATASTPVIVLSGNDDVEARASALAAGATDYLVKLPPKEDFLKCIRRHARGNDAEELAHADEQARADAHGDTLDSQVMAAFRHAGGRTDFALTLIDQFVQEADSRVTTLRDAASRRDAHALKATAHTLKGSSLIIGAMRLAALCGRLDDKARVDSTASSALVATIGEELIRVRAALAVERQTIVQSGSSTATGTASAKSAGKPRAL